VWHSAQFLNPSQAAERLGVSAKALRLYEQRGLIVPARTSAGWRAYGPAEMSVGAEIVALRGLGLSLAQVAAVLGGDPECLELALAEHEKMLGGKVRELTNTVDKVRAIRAGIAAGLKPIARVLTPVLRPVLETSLAIDLPWPWGGERFELQDVRPLTYIIGPLGSGKTRLAMAIAQGLPDAAFIGLDRLEDGDAKVQAQLDADAALRSRIETMLAWLVGEGAMTTPALLALLVAMETARASVLVIDMVEQGLDGATQDALGAYLRRRAAARPLFLLTRSSAILDLGAANPDIAIILCPANHSPPSLVSCCPGAPGYEAVATCLASPEVRARTAGVIAWRPEIA
jgi:DNA-binding transcriptional MerR regulator